VAIIDDALTAIMQNAYPDSTDEDIQAKVNKLKAAGSNAIQSALSFIPNMSSTSASPDQGTTPAPFQGPTGPADTSAGMGIVTPPAASVPPTPSMSLPALSSPASSTAPNTPAASAPTTPGASAIATPPSDVDNAARQAFLAQQQKTHELGTIPVALAGVGEAIQNASVPFGGAKAGNETAQVQDVLQKGEEQRKAQFEQNLQTDPNSDVSKAYRQMVLEIAPDLAKQPNFQGMTAQEIGDKLPLIDEVMKAKATEAQRQTMMQYQQTIKGQGFLGQAQKSYNTDPLVTKALETKSAMEKVQDMIVQGQSMPVSNDLVSLVLAPALTGVKRFNSVELAATGGGKDLPDRMKQAFTQMTTGKLTPENAQLLSKVAEIAHTHALSDLQQEGITKAKQLQAQVGGDWRDHYQEITGQSLAPTTPTAPVTPAAPSTNKTPSGYSFTVR